MTPSEEIAQLRREVERQKEHNKLLDGSLRQERNQRKAAQARIAELEKSYCTQDGHEAFVRMANARADATRAAVIEKCAKVAEGYRLKGRKRIDGPSQFQEDIAAAIRALAATTASYSTHAGEWCSCAGMTAADCERQRGTAPTTGVERKCNCYRSTTDPYVANPYPCPVHDAHKLQRTPESE